MARRGWTEGRRNSSGDAPNGNWQVCTPKPRPKGSPWFPSKPEPAAAGAPSLKNARKSAPEVYPNMTDTGPSSSCQRPDNPRTAKTEPKQNPDYRAQTSSFWRVAARKVIVASRRIRLPRAESLYYSALSPVG